jgi:hypothetical protein
MLRRLPLAVLSVLSLLILVLLLVGGLAWVRGAPALDPVLSDVTAPLARRCPQCAWIESKREVLPGTYEYTTRMVDGSSSVFLETLPVTWRVGERLMLIGGAGR